MIAAKRFKNQEKSSWQGRMSEKKEQKRCFEEEIVDAPFEVILMLLPKIISSEIIHAVVVANAMNDEISSISSQIVEQIKVILK